MKSQLLFTSLCSLPLLAHAATNPTEGEKPNVLFLFADDYSYFCLTQDRSDEVNTPNLDRLMQRSTHFTHAFNQGAWSGAVSAASRAMMVTGENLWIAATHSKTPALQQDRNWPLDAPKVKESTLAPFNTSWPEYMKAEGYDTYFAGKWHVDIDPHTLFDHVRNVRGGMAEQHQDCYDRKFEEGITDKWKPYDTSYGGYWEGGKHWSEVLRNDALLYMEMAEKSDAPFFMYLGFNAPHDPRQAPREFQEMYPAEQIALPENFVPEYPYKDSIGCSIKLRDEKLAPFPRNERSIQVTRQEYYALITHLDKQIGIILDALEKSGKLENTYIFFTADHGISVGDHGFLGKQNMYDASMRVPLLVAGPDVPEGKCVDELVYLQDVMATALDVAGSEGEEVVNFKSLLPLAKGERGAKGRDAVYGCYLGLQRMVRDKEYKMIIYPKYNLVRLYNVERDPNELHDLSGDKKYRKRMERMLRTFQSLQKEIHDPLDVSPYFNRHLSSQGMK